MDIRGRVPEAQDRQLRLLLRLWLARNTEVDRLLGLRESGHHMLPALLVSHAVELLCDGGARGEETIS